MKVNEDGLRFSVDDPLILRPSCQSKKAIRFSEIVLSLSAHVITRLLLSLVLRWVMHS